MYRNTYVEINLANIRHNIKTIKEKYKYKYYIGVIKGNAYGHGMGIVKTLLDAGINFLAVSNLDEALEVRKIDKNIGILCLEPIDTKYMDICEENNISICVNDYDYYLELCKLKYKLKIHLKIDSGMNRLGFDKKEEIDKVYQDIREHDNLYLEGIFSHFATSGVYDKSYDNQLARFKELTKDVDLDKIEIVHIDRSVTMCVHEKIDFVNGIRLGIIMYGFEAMPSGGSGLRVKLRNIKWNSIRKIKDISFTIPYVPLGLKPAFTLISEVLQVKDVKKGDYVGYGTLYQAKEDMKIAVIDIGYADGINRHRMNSNMEINGALYPIVGDICMGMTILKVDDKVKKHDKVIVIGENVSVRKIANHMNTTHYEVMSMIDSSIPRRYV